nr:CheR family methyltransferase [Paenibacillus turpanensis]
MANRIADYCGIQYGDNLSSLASKVSGRLEELGCTCMQYMELLKTNPDEWRTLTERITINETYFFREEQQLKEMNRLLPGIASVNYGGIRIWSAACSTGEEPYSLLMSIAEQGSVPLESVSVQATDINRRVLEIARKGWYHRNSLCFRRTPEPLKQKYFVADGDGFAVMPSIRSRVQFDWCNLLRPGDKPAPESSLDIIFCRNVLIYFELPVIRDIVSYFHSRLKPGGYLFLGHAETINGLETGFESVHEQGTFYYRKGELPNETVRSTDR